MYTRDNGEMIKLTVLETTDMQMVLLTMVSGKMISNMVRVLRPGQMEQDTRAPITRVRSMERGLYSLLMDQCILVTFSKMRLVVVEFISGQMAKLMMEIGRKIRCMGLVH